MMEMTDIRHKVQLFFDGYPTARFQAGQILAMPGSPLPGVIYIEAGVVEQYHIDKDGNRFVVNAFRSGAFFPMSWVINQTENEYFYEVIVPLRARVARPDEAMEFLRQNSDVLLDLLSRVYRGTDVLLKRLALMASASAMSRLAYGLVLEAYRTEPDEAGMYHIHTTQAVLAARSGLARETVSRQLKRLAAAGLVVIDDGVCFKLPDLEKLAGL